MDQNIHAEIDQLGKFAQHAVLYTAEQAPSYLPPSGTLPSR